MLLFLRQPLCWPHPLVQVGLTSLCSSKRQRQTSPDSPIAIAIAAAALGGEGVVGEAKKSYTLRRKGGDGTEGPVCPCTLQAWG